MRTRSALLVTPVVLTALLAAPLPVLAASADVVAPAPATADLADVERIATEFLAANAADYGVSVADVSDLAVRSSYTSAHNGVTHVNVFQRYQGLEVFSAAATVNVRSDGSVLHVGEVLLPDLAAAPSTPADAEASPVEAVEAAAEALDLEAPEDLRPVVAARKAADPVETLLTDGGISDEPIPTTLGWQPTDAGLRLAYQVVIDDSTDVHLYNATVDAETGELLDVEDWTDQHEEGQIESTMARGSTAQAAAAALAVDEHTADDGHDHGPSTHRSNDPVQDGSSYTVYEIPKESPNDGPPTVVTNPADGTASPFGWHDADGMEGPEFTTTRGNNVHSYLDRDNDNQPDAGVDVDGGPDLIFDFTTDLGTSPLDYQPAAVTNLFYLNNVVHDVMVLYGFDEQAGNFQAVNYDGDTGGGDYVRAEAQDGGGVNNANFSTPAADGSAPRMQMYLWNPSGGVLPNQVVVDSGPAAGTYGMTGAAFGPTFDEAGVSGPFALVDDGSGTTEGCGPLVGFPAGAIAIADRGTCPFADKVLNAQNAGAVAVIIGNNAPGAPITVGGTGPTVTIPSGMVTQADATTIKAGLPTTGTVRANPDIPPQRDGDLENGIIIHEYAHGISNRLTGGLNVNCLSGQEQMGEGWSDYYGITMLLDPELDDPEGARGMGPYAVYQDDRSGNGIRPRPYSRDMNTQPFTYDRIKTNSWITGASLATPHGVGHGWNSVLWDLTWNLIDAHGFNDNIYDGWDAGGNNRSLQYVTDGLKMQGCAPGFVAGRDGILAATEALGGADTCIVWSTFARRGLGYSAVQGTTGRDDNTEAFDVPAECVAAGDGFQDMNPQGGSDELLLRTAGAAVPMTFGLGGNRGLDVLGNTHSFASRQVDCTTLAPVQFALTTPTERQARTQLRYNRGQDEYFYLWDTDEEWAGTCRQFVVTVEDGTQHRVNVQLS